MKDNEMNNGKTVIVFSGDREELRGITSSADRLGYTSACETEVDVIAGMVSGSAAFPVSAIVLDMRSEIEPTYVKDVFKTVKGISPFVKLLALIDEKDSWASVHRRYPQFTHFITQNDMGETLDDMVRMYLRDTEMLTPHKNGNKFSTIPFSIGMVGMGGVGKTVAREVLTKFSNVKDIRIYNRTPEKARSVRDDIRRALYSDEQGLSGKIDDVKSIKDLLDTDFLVIAAKEKYDPKTITKANRRHTMLKYDIESLVSIADAISDYKGVVLVFSNPLEYTTRMINVPWNRKIGLSPDGHVGGRFEELLISHYIDLYKEDIEKKYVPFEDGDLVKVKGGIVIGEHGDSMVPLYSQVRFYHMVMSEDHPGEPVLKVTPFSKTKPRLKNRKSQITLALRNRGEGLYVQGIEPFYETGRVLVETLNQILNEGITYGVVSCWDPEHRAPIFLQLPARWKLVDNKPIIEFVYRPGDIMYLSKSGDQKPLSEEEVSNFLISREKVLDLYEWGSRLENEVRQKHNNV